MLVFVLMCVIAVLMCMIVILIYSDECDVCNVVYCNVDDDECDEYDK